MGDEIGCYEIRYFCEIFVHCVGQTVFPDRFLPRCNDSNHEAGDLLFPGTWFLEKTVIGGFSKEKTHLRQRPIAVLQYIPRIREPGTEPIQILFRNQRLGPRKELCSLVEIVCLLSSRDFPPYSIQREICTVVEDRCPPLDQLRAHVLQKPTLVL